MSGTHQRLEELLFNSTHQPLSEADRKELNTLLRDNPEARTHAARHLVIDALLAETLATGEHTTAFNTIPISAGHALKRPNWLARAAAWVGAFHLFSHNAKATTLILMKKSVTSVTAAILLVGGSGIYVIHRNNESSRARVEIMETEIQSLNDQLGIKTTSFANRGARDTNAQKTVNISQAVAIYDRYNQLTRQEKSILTQFENQLMEMDAEALKNLLLDAEKLGNPINHILAKEIMKVLIGKDPAVATQIASQLIGSGSEFQFHLSHDAVKAFDAWLSKDPAAADAWYVATAASGGLNSKSIPMSGLEDLAIDRSFARSRFSKQLLTNPTEAAAMLATMLPADVTAALKEITDPDALRQILPKLSPEQKAPAAEGAIKAMAAKDLDAAFTWAKSLEMGERERDSLLAAGIEAAVANGKLDLPGVVERSKNLNLDAKRRSAMQVSAAIETSLIPQKNPGVIETDNRVHWDRVADRIDWLRKEAPSDSADRMVGEYLGRLSYASQNLEKSLESYQQEVSRQGEIDPEFTITFARYLSLAGNDSAYTASLKLLDQLPASEKRNDAIESIKMNH
jgi:hypothetical protein